MSNSKNTRDNAANETGRQKARDSFLEYALADDQATQDLGSALAKALDQANDSKTKSHGLIFLNGELGAGKTTFSRGFLRFFGHTNAVKSPTYTLVEPYELESVSVYHFDLYRLTDQEEFYYLGFEDYFTSNSICLIEWPEKAGDFLPCCDIDINIRIKDEERVTTLESRTVLGAHVLELMKRAGD